MAGMRRFCQFLAGTPGRDAVMFWLEVQRLQRVERDDATRRHALLTDIHMAYFEDDQLTSLAGCTADGGQAEGSAGNRLDTRMSSTPM